MHQLCRNLNAMLRRCAVRPAAGGGCSRRFATHATLIVGMLVFLFPFLWMVSTSFKTDEELPETRLLPSVPRFQDHSPYVKPVPEPTKPIDVEDVDWDRVVPKLLARTKKAVTDAQSAGAAHPLDATVDAEQLNEAASRKLLDSVSAKLNRTLWTGDSDAFDKAFDACSRPRPRRRALDDSIARFELANVQLRTLDTQIFTLTPGKRNASGVPRRLRSGEDRGVCEWRADAIPV